MNPILGILVKWIEYVCLDSEIHGFFSFLYISSQKILDILYKRVKILFISL